MTSNGSRVAPPISASGVDNLSKLSLIQNRSVRCRVVRVGKAGLKQEGEVGLEMVYVVSRFQASRTHTLFTER